MSHRGDLGLAPPGWFGHGLLTRPSSATAVSDLRRTTWRPTVGRTAGPGDPRRTKFRGTPRAKGSKRGRCRDGARRQSSHHRHCSARSTSLAHRVGLDVSAEREEVIVVCHGKAFESPLVQVPCATAVIVLVMPADVRHSHPAHQAAPTPRRSAAGRPDASDWASGSKSQIHRITLQPLDQHSLEGVVVPLLVKQSKATVPPIEDVIDHPCFDRVSGSWHPGSFVDAP